MSASKYGYRHGLIPAAHPLGYHDMNFFMVQEPPDAPDAYDKTNGANGFQMLGNGPDPTLTVNGGSPVGDCGFVATVNVEYVDSCETDEPFTFPTSDVVVADYLRYNHGQDIGVQNPQLFAYWHNVGLPWASRLVGSGSVNYRDWDESWAYLYLFGSGVLQVAVSEAMEDATNAGEPWDYTGSAADDNILGGHDVCVFARHDATTGVLATWGQRQLFTQAWWKHCVLGLDVCLTDRQVARNGNGYGVDLEKLKQYVNTPSAARAA